MKLPKDQPFWTSVILHLVVLLALFFATMIETLKPKDKLHVFEMVMPSSEQSVSSAASPPVAAPAVQMPELPPVPDLAPVPEPVAPVARPTPPTPRPAPEPAAKPKPTPKPVPKLTTLDDFIQEHGAPTPRQPTPQPTTRKPVTAPTIDVPQLYVPTNTSSNAPSARPLSPQQLSALDAYSSQLRSRIDAAWAKPTSLAGVRTAATVVFEVSASGRITNARLKPGSGNGAFDQSVLAAFRKVISAGPTPTGQGHTFTMTFRMTD